MADLAGLAGCCAHVDHTTRYPARCKTIPKLFLSCTKCPNWGTVVDPALFTDASRLITGDRQTAYGDPDTNLGRIGQLVGAWVGKDLNGADMAVIMALVKIGRMKSGYHRDNYVDAIAYLAIAEGLDRECW